MSYTALYRKWRPVSFDEVKGQDHIVKTLKNQKRRDESDMHICSAVQEVQEKQVLPRYSPKR